MNREQAARLMDRRNWTQHLTEKLGPEAQALTIVTREVKAINGSDRPAYVSEVTMPN